MAKSKKTKAGSMKANIDEGIYLRIEGELAKNNSLPWAYIKNIGDCMQNLVHTLAKFDLDTDAPIDLENFDIHLCGFFPGSAVPEWKLSPVPKPVLYDDFEKQRNVVSKRVDTLLALTDTGNYMELKKMYKIPLVRNEVTDAIYKLTQSFGNAPVSVVKPDRNGTFRKLYAVRKFQKSTRDKIVVKITESPTAIEDPHVIGFGKIQAIEKKGKLTYAKVLEFYKQKATGMAYAPQIITLPKRQYELAYPLRCSIEKEDGYSVLQYEPLGLIGTGEDIEEAEINFNIQFDYMYQRFNQLDDSQLSPQLQFNKQTINHIVTKVTKI